MQNNVAWYNSLLYILLVCLLFQTYFVVDTINERVETQKELDKTRSELHIFQEISYLLQENVECGGEE